MGAFSAAAQAQAEGRHVICAVLAHFHFLTTPWRIHMGTGSLTADSVTWQGTGQLINAETIKQVINGNAERFTLAAAGVSQDILDIASTDFAAEAEGRFLDILIQFYDADRALIETPMIVRRGVMDVIEVSESRVNKDELVRSISVEAASVLSRRTRASLGYWTSYDQQILYPTDLGLDRVPSLADKTVPWPDFS